MHTACKRELATLILKTVEVHEASYQPGTSMYGMSWEDAADTITDDEDLRVLVSAMLATGHTDFPAWAESVLTG